MYYYLDKNLLRHSEITAEIWKGYVVKHNYVN